MIENFILSVIKFLNHIVIELKRAYCETYGDKEWNNSMPKLNEGKR
mgnify:CR=1 FL=1